MLHATCGPVQASLTMLVRSSTFPLAISPAFACLPFHQTCTVQQPPWPPARTGQPPARRPQRRAASAVQPKRPELVPDEVRRRDQHDRDRLRDDLPDADLDEESEDPEGSDVGDHGDDETA